MNETTTWARPGEPTPGRRPESRGPIHSTEADAETTMQIAHPSHVRNPQTNLRGFLRLLWRRRLTVILVIIVIAAGVGIGLAAAPRQYTAVTQVAATASAQPNGSTPNFTDLLGTLANVATSRPVLDQVHEALPERSVAQLQDEVSAEVLFGTVIVQVRVTDANPRIAAQVANGVATLLPQHDPTNGSLVLTVTEPAVVPSTYSSPDLQVSILAGALLALVLAVIAAVVRDRAARTVDSAEDVAAGTGTAVLGVLPEPREPEGLAAAESRSPDFVALRALRVALEFASIEQPTRSLVVAPAVSDPWGGWLEVNLATALADVGHRVLLIDANRVDRRRHPLFDYPEAPGLYDLLSGTVALEDAVVCGPVDDVAIIPLGCADEAAPSLLEMRFRQLLEEIDEKYDVILIRSAPINDSDDARIMAIDGGLLLAVPSGRVRPAALGLAMQNLSSVRTRFLGSVIVGGRA